MAKYLRARLYRTLKAKLNLIVHLCNGEASVFLESCSHMVDFEIFGDDRALVVEIIRKN